MLAFIESEKRCYDDIRTFEDVMTFVSLILSMAAIYLQTRNRKNLHFPHNIPLLISISAFLYTFGRVLAFAFRSNDLLRRYSSLCNIQGILSMMGFVGVFWIWVSSLIVLYAAMVRKVPILQMRKKKWYYYVPLTMLLTIIFTICTTC